MATSKEQLPFSFNVFLQSQILHSKYTACCKEALVSYVFAARKSSRISKAIATLFEETISEVLQGQEEGHCFQGDRHYTVI